MRTRRYAPPEKVVKTNLRRSSSATRSAPTCRDVEVGFTAPASVVALLRDTMDAFARPGD